MKFTNRYYKTTSRLITASIISITLSACGSGGGETTTTQQTEQPLSELSIYVNPALDTETESFPTIDTSGIERRVAVIRDELGNVSKFIENELIIMTNDTAALQEFITRWNGELIKTIDIQSLGFPGGTDAHMIRVNTDAADDSRLRDDLLALDANARGATEVSSDTAIKTLAAGASEAVKGLRIAINWVGASNSIALRSTSDAPRASRDSGGHPGRYSRNAFEWDYMNAGSEQDIGVTEAWHLLDEQDKLNKTVGLAILDMGFSPSHNEDIDPSYIARSTIPGVSAIGAPNLGCSGGNPCPWHGNMVANAAMGLLDNDRGGAGPAGAVARPILINTLPDYFTGMFAIAQAINNGADIINMSYGMPIPGILSWSAELFQDVTAMATISGKLLFAAAGNSNSDVDDESCLFATSICWENTLLIPCESRGVICVGGLDVGSKSRAVYRPESGSNYGSKGSVDIFAPYKVLVGGDPNHDSFHSYLHGGTSFSSPYAAGVAALIWAANPALSGGQVKDIMMNTAHSSPDATVPRYVNAQAAVQEALGTSVNINLPVDGAAYTRGTQIQFVANAFSSEHGSATLSWNSNIDGSIGSGDSFYNRDLAPGTHVITVTATFTDGFRKTDTITIDVDNVAPTVNIQFPSGTTRYYLSEPIRLTGTSIDSDNPANSYELYDYQVSWKINGSYIGTGHVIEAAASDFGVGGPYLVEFTGNDGFSAPTTSQMLIYVDPDPLNLPPVVEITSPASGTSYVADQSDAGGYYRTVALSWTATDTEEGLLPFSSTEWTVSIDGGVSQPLNVTEKVLTIPSPGGFSTVLKLYSVKLYAPSSGATSRYYDITLKVTDTGVGDPASGNKTSSPYVITVRVDNFG